MLKMYIPMRSQLQKKLRANDLDEYEGETIEEKTQHIQSVIDMASKSIKVATLKLVALLIIYILLSLFVLNPSKKDNQSRKDTTPDFFAASSLDEYIAKLNKKAPLEGPDNITIVRAYRDKKNIMYDMLVKDLPDSESADFIKSITSFKYVLCDQKQESFFLSRGIGLSWNYFNSQQKYIGTVNITPQECSWAGSPTKDKSMSHSNIL